MDPVGSSAPADLAYWAHDRLTRTEVSERLSGARVTVTAVGAADAAPVAEVLAASGVTAGAGEDLEVVVVDDYLHPDLADYNEGALSSGRPWLLAGSVAVETWVGPIFVPDRGPCWECLAQRRRRLNRPGCEHADADRPQGHGSTPATRTASAGMIAAQALRWLAVGQASGLHERLLSIDTRTWRSAVHTVAWRPQCPACGVADASLDRGAARIALAPRGKLAAVEAGMRTVAAEETARRLGHHVSSVTGIVSRLARLPAATAPLHVYGAGGASGKGTTDAQARAGALCEALERYSAEFAGDEPRKTATMGELGDRAIHPNSVMGFSSAQYELRDRTNGSASFRTRVPLPFDPAAAIDWTPLWSVSEDRERFLPTAYCYLGARVTGHEMVVPDSNGNAAGNTIEEAILQGLLELVERDHVALWWYNRLTLPGIDLASFDDRWLDAAAERIAADGREVWALDLTADLGVPVAAALSAMPDGSVTMGLGAHLDLHQAAVRAVTELVQLSYGGISAGLGHGPQERLDSPDAAYLRPAVDVRPHGARDTPMTATGDVRADLDACRASVEARGLEMLVLDQTRPDVGLPVVKVVVPGLRHFWPRFAPGRLYDVPVERGHLAASLAETELNQVPPTP